MLGVVEVRSWRGERRSQGEKWRGGDGCVGGKDGERKEGGKDIGGGVISCLHNGN